MYNFVPRRPVKSFQDLEVYQKLLGVCVVVVKRITLPLVPLPKLSEAKRIKNQAIKTPRGCAKYSPEVEEISSRTISLALDLPIKIATAHSLRFSDQAKAIATLEEVMLGCNLLIVYLEQYRDILNVPLPKLPDVKSKVPADSCVIESEFFEEQIRTLLTIRFKVMHLQMSWKKFIS